MINREFQARKILPFSQNPRQNPPRFSPRLATLEMSRKSGGPFESIELHNYRSLANFVHSVDRSSRNSSHPLTRKLMEEQSWKKGLSMTSRSRSKSVSARAWRILRRAKYGGGVTGHGVPNQENSTRQTMTGQAGIVPRVIESNLPFVHLARLALTSLFFFTWLLRPSFFPFPVLHNSSFFFLGSYLEQSVYLSISVQNWSAKFYKFVFNWFIYKSDSHSVSVVSFVSEL